MKYILGIETSCDETAAAVVGDGTDLVASTIASSKELHETTGGIVPEIAARKQIEFIIPVLSKTLADFGKAINAGNRVETIAAIDSLAVTVGPGLIGSLLIGVEAAKTLSLAWGKPIVPVNHLVGHIYANFVNTENGENPIEFPALVLIVSGGHTDLVLMKGHGNLEFIGSTLDDAAGEAFDKTARLLGLSKYLGGAELSRLASSFNAQDADSFLPRPLLDKNNYDFSFSGLKTSVKRVVENSSYSADKIAYEFEEAVVDVLVSKTMRAAKEFKAKSLLLGGGVAANTKLRSRMNTEAVAAGLAVKIPPMNLCTDNAIYIASAAYFNYTPRPLSQLKADPSLSILSKV
ncbi:tRNA (adenosine(37)-N6)-threonylcarbamoyltransferase complex transferase subunit TsaD [candidate division WWE3 bacterium]|jgi:N6-L-threonylcarbamoyladenine synthase|uniref:tRNA N6-adenosine threonylcarbamoyltransferase n=1 Tax=candidate division WWE3 bacterium TaxID=2053526 RepID=A0A3A4ZC95_UNCKA|nr:MAG: tRNA (adenosine(37)-N6)-threonylcarbamoyltransferase complex transferase subunit TsaD [candidate division WWE3 bacterium]